MRAELKGLHSPDIFDLENYHPESKDDFCFYLELFVGPKNQKGSELFGVTVCTPKWLLNNTKKKELVFLNHYLIVSEYDYMNLYNRIREYIQSQDANSWEELAIKIGRSLYWEFEDYQE